jgi:hypothetical protein
MKKAKKPLPKKPAAPPVPTPTPSPAELLAEGTRILRHLQATVQFGGQISGPGIEHAVAVEQAVAAMFRLARSATMNCAMAAHNPRTAALAQEAASRMDWIAVLRGNPDRLPWFAGALARLDTFHTYRPRGPHKKASGTERTDPKAGLATAEWLMERIVGFWRGVVSRGLRIPPIPDEVRARLLAPKYRLKGREWAKALYDNLPKEPNSSQPFEVYGFGRAYFERAAPRRKRPNADLVAVGFIKLAGERFTPLLKREVKQAESSYHLMMRERGQKNIGSR